MERVRALLREPALLIDLGETLVLFLVAFGIGINGDQQSYLTAAIIALVGLAKAFTTKPFPVTLLTDAVRSVLVVFASFGVGLTADQITLTATLVGTVITVIARAQITPRRDPVVSVDGAGAGPVRGNANLGREGGYANGGVIASLGVALIVIGVLLLLLSALGALGVSLTVSVVLIATGVLLWVVGGSVR